MLSNYQRHNQLLEMTRNIARAFQFKRYYYGIVGTIPLKSC
jgi:hypothetical protein